MDIFIFYSYIYIYLGFPCFRPINVVCWKRAICLEFMEKVRLIVVQMDLLIFFFIYSQITFSYFCYSYCVEYFFAPSQILMWVLFFKNDGKSNSNELDFCPNDCISSIKLLVYWHHLHLINRTLQWQLFQVKNP